jgi:hypothetical protein
VCEVKKQIEPQISKECGGAVRLKEKRIMKVEVLSIKPRDVDHALSTLAVVSIKLEFENGFSLILNDLRVIATKLGDLQVLSPLRFGRTRIPYFVLSHRLRDEIDGDVLAAYFEWLDSQPAAQNEAAKAVTRG